MATDMVIMQSNRLARLRPATLLLAMLPGFAHADFQIKPSISSALYGYGIKNQTADADRGIAFEVAPELELSFKGSWLTSNLTIENQNVSYDDAQRDNKNLLNYRWNNSASFLNDSINIRAGANQSNTSTAGASARYQDRVNATVDLAKVSSQFASFSYTNDRFEWALFDIGLNTTHSSSDRLVTEFDEQTGQEFGLDNSTVSGSFELKTRDRNRKFFWGVVGNASKTDRDLLESQFNRRAQAIVGVPFFWRVSMIATGSVESNSNLLGANTVFSEYQNHHSVGGGFEWKITDRSWWNITYNKVNNAKEDKEYVGTAFELVPSRRTKLSGSIDKRFFGRTAQAQGSYQLKHLRMALNVSDTVGSLLGLDNSDVESSLFVCPPGVVPGLDSCFQPPTLNYIPAQGERYFNVANPGADLSEFMVVRRNVSYTVGYDFNRLKLNSRIGQRKDQLIERNAVRDDKFVNLSANWQLNARNSVTLSGDYSDLVYELDGQERGGELTGTLKSLTLSLDRKINKALTANMNVKRLTVAYKDDARDYQENRAWVGFQYKF